jgi:GTP pyrophosphokinase
MQTLDTPAITPLPSLLDHSHAKIALAVDEARIFAQTFLLSETLSTGENALAHADGVAHILKNLGGSSTLQAVSYLVDIWPYLATPFETIRRAFGAEFAQLAQSVTQLAKVQRQTRSPLSLQTQNENIRKMLLAFSHDLRVVLLRLASRLQTLRHGTSNKIDLPIELVHEALYIFSPLANRLGLWSLKWEMEDLAFRCLEPQTYQQIARSIEAKRSEREQYIQTRQQQLAELLQVHGITAQLQGRAKHIYSIVKKMRGKHLAFEGVMDLFALRVLVSDTSACYSTLALLHSHFLPVEGQFDDYIAKPKPNGYQSLHTVIRDAQGGAPIEIQIRSHAMHEQAEHGLAAHWVYKEAGQKGYAGVSAQGLYEQKIALLRQLLAWQQDIHGAESLFEDRIYVLTPQAQVIELPQGATPVDFAYALHTQLGHRCRGARIEGHIAPLHTPLQNGQTVEIVAGKEDNPSRDWLGQNPVFLASPRAKAKVRAWFNAKWQAETQAKGREYLEKMLQKEGLTAWSHQDLATRIGYSELPSFYEALGKEELALKTVLAAVTPAVSLMTTLTTLMSPEIGLLGPGSESGSAIPATQVRLKPPVLSNRQKCCPYVLVMGMDHVMTELASCCRPAPPDPIVGFITRGKGISVHRQDCKNQQGLATRHPERSIAVTWLDTPSHLSDTAQATAAIYTVDVVVQAVDRPGLLRDVGEVFAKAKLNVQQVKTHIVWAHQEKQAHMLFTVQLHRTPQLDDVLKALQAIPGIHQAKRR